MMPENELTPEEIAWVRSESRRGNKRAEAWEKAKASLLGQALIWITVGIGLLVWTTVQKWVKEQ